MTQLKLPHSPIATAQQIIETHLNRAKWHLYTSGDRELAPNEFRISQIGYPSRWLWYEKYRPKDRQVELRQTDENLRMNTFPGTAMHEVFQKYDPEAIIEKETEVHFDNGKIILTGHIDQDRLNPNLIVDYKAAKNLYYIRKNKKANTSHIHQVNTYASLVKRDYFGIAYIDKINYEHLVYTYPTNPSMFEKDIARLEFILGCKTAPKCDGESYYCGFCSFNHICEVRKQ